MIDKALASMQRMHQEETASKGLGAIHVYAPGQFWFEPINRLQRFHHWTIHKDFFQSTDNQYQSDNLVDLIVEISQIQPEKFVWFRPISRGWFLDRFLIVKVCDKVDELSLSSALDSLIEGDSEDDLSEENSEQDVRLISLLDRMLSSIVHAEGLKQKGQGAVIGNFKGEFRFIPLSRLPQLEKYPYLGAFANLNYSLSKLVEQCPCERFILIYQIYQPFFPFGKKLLVVQEELSLPMGNKVWGFPENS